MTTALLSIEEAEEILRPYLAGIYEVITKGADGDYSENYTPKAKAAHTTTARATNRHCHMIERAALLAAKHPGKIRPFNSLELRGIAVEEKIALIFKKQKEKALFWKARETGLRSSAALTNQRKDFISQASIPEIKDLCHLEAGYCENAFTGAVIGAYITCPGRVRNYWQINLTELNQRIVVTRLFEQRPLPVEEPAIVARHEPAKIVSLERKEDGGT